MKDRKQWRCPRCLQPNDADDRWCYFCKLDSQTLKTVFVEDKRMADLYLEIAAGE